ncbi:trypsin-like serine protease [Jannaschia seohaensis]|uniref:Putative secreted protein n=1 Tax=Jannaschia seohaensis TaxID=475081 RepID=A0A2Y9C415_9RHOB|nr:trypsin-like serine protease [Jannaschia seohaensis]PWJ22525.1 putative secreted protein [Jannaschia seohaensis]SSA38803.1 VPLPA-CTERM protein sorting domain-containing protein [Jannaschia seohaensis]
MKTLAKAVAMLGGLILGGLSGGAQAVTINATLTEADSKALAAPFDAVVSLDLGGALCTGTLVSTIHILTARHCILATPAATTVRFDDKTNGQTFSRGVSDIANMVGQNYEDGTDISILTMVQPVTSIAPMRLAAGALVGEGARLVGYGVSAVADAIDGTPDGERWAADNTIDNIGQSAVFPQSMIGSLLEADFDNPTGTSNSLSSVGSSPTMLFYEGAPAVGDSGGPLLVNRGGEWQIAGVLTGGTETYGAYGDVSWWTSVFSPAARGFIETNSTAVFAPVPLPASLALLLVGLGGLVALRWRV